MFHLVSYVAVLPPLCVSLFVHVLCVSMHERASGMLELWVLRADVCT